MSKREKGKISKWFEDKKYGFARVKNYDRDVFIHINEFQDKNLTPEDIEINDEIECAIKETKKGWNGVDIGLLSRKNKNNISKKPENPNEKYFIPKDTNEIIKLGECDNFNLLFNKYPEFDDRYKTKIDKIERYLKKNFQKVSFEGTKSLFIKRQRQLINSMGLDGFKIGRKEYEIDWRLAVGLGEISVYETSIKLHHIYGIPFIPASGFKGAVRNWAINIDFDGNEKTALWNEEFCDIFGSPKESIKGEQKGGVIFFDVYPTNLPTLELDIINNHYVDYYKDGKSSPPGDYGNPNLIKFITIKDTTFEFAYAFKNENIKNTINEWVGGTLKYQGLGAKTSVGYGYFSKKDKSDNRDNAGDRQIDITNLIKKFNN